MKKFRSKLWIDIETYSSVDLPKTGVYRYAASDDFEILMAAWSVDGVDVELAIGYDEIMAIPGLLDPDVLKVAHNAQFERVCFSYFFGMAEYGAFLPPEEWHDTQAVAGQQGYPQKLSLLAQSLEGELKDEAGTRLINVFCKPNRKKTRTLPEEKPEEWKAFCDYCVQDVYTLISVDHNLGGHVNETEYQIFLADQRCNDRGIRIDRSLARQAMKAADANQSRQVLELIEATNWTVLNPNSVPQMMNWVRQEGLDAPNLRKETVEKLLEGDLTADQRAVLELRQDLALVASKKYGSALRAVLPDGRLRGTLKYFGAHTGRWAGRGTQLQNLPREVMKIAEEALAKVKAMKDLGVSKSDIEAFITEEVVKATDLAIRILKTTGEADSHTLKALVRAMFYGPFTVVDYAAIEARVLAGLAGEEWAMQAFREGRDIYVETGERMGGLGRSQGKIAVLALGYNGGSNSLVNMAGGASFYADPDTGLIWNEDHGDPMTDKQIRDQLVMPWRRANPKIVELWQLLGDSWGEVGPAGPMLHTTESRDKLGRAIHLHLPSGRPITYHGVRWEKYKVQDPDTNRWIPKQGWRYADPKNPFNPKQRIGTYGGRLAENATQAVARDIMAEAIVRLENEGYKVVAHVHDEIIVEGEHDVEEIKRIMTDVPAWAGDIPIDGEGFNCLRYRKG